jgi:hypothetical protein
MKEAINKAEKEAEKNRPKTKEEKAVENIDKLVEEIQSDDKEELINTVTLDSAKLKALLIKEEEKRKDDAKIDSVIESLK